MPIHPLPQFEADLEEDRKIYEQLKPPTSIVVRFGILKMVGEFPYSGDVKPGCGSKMVVRTHRGVELAEMLTSTCPNSGCSKSVSRKEMLEYIDNSGGKDYPFFNQGKVLRLATVDDLNHQAKIDAERPKFVMQAREFVLELNLPMKVVDAEPLLGGDRLTFYFTSEDRIDFRDLVAKLASVHHTRIEMRQVGARDEARLTADYERCGQHCCCKQFLKVLKPVSMKSAKIQKATLDPLKISGRCGRLMCCLRYEDETYDDLRKRLPKKKSRVLTPTGWGIVIDSQILTQLVLVRLETSDTDVAVPVEELKMGAAALAAAAEEEAELDGDMAPGGATAAPARPAPPPPGGGNRPPRPDRGPRPEGQRPEGQHRPPGAPASKGGAPGGPNRPPARPNQPSGGGGGGGGQQRPDRPPSQPQNRGPGGPPQPPQGQSSQSAPPRQRDPGAPGQQRPPENRGPAEGGEGGAPRPRRRRRRRGGGGGGGGPGGGGNPGGPGSQPPPPSAPPPSSN